MKHTLSLALLLSTAAHVQASNSAIRPASPKVFSQSQVNAQIKAAVATEELEKGSQGRSSIHTANGIDGNITADPTRGLKEFVGTVSALVPFVVTQQPAQDGVRNTLAAFQEVVANPNMVNVLTLMGLTATTAKACYIALGTPSSIKGTTRSRDSVVTLKVPTHLVIAVHKACNSLTTATHSVALTHDQMRALLAVSRQGTRGMPSGLTQEATEFALAGAQQAATDVLGEQGAQQLATAASALEAAIQDPTNIATMLNAAGVTAQAVQELLPHLTIADAQKAAKGCLAGCAKKQVDDTAAAADATTKAGRKIVTLELPRQELQTLQNVLEITNTLAITVEKSAGTATTTV